MEGIGGFGLAAERSGMETVAYSEIDPACSELLATRWPQASPLGDITKITEEVLHALGPVDLVTAGWPCQDVSVAGRRAGLAGARSGLWREVVRVLGVLRPRWFVGENVPGLLSSKGGEDMGTVLWQLGELGYGWAYRVLDARYFGVAQRRRRVLIVGCLGDPARAAEVLLEPEGGEWHPAASREASRGVAGTLDGGSGERGWPQDVERMTFVSEIAHTLCTARGGPSDNSANLIATALTGGGQFDDQALGQLIPEVAPMLGSGNYGQGNLEEGVPMMVFNPYRTLEKDGSVSSGFAERPVVDALHGLTGNKEPLVVATAAVRYLLPVECERLQGFPDGWTEGFADSTRYRMLGNAICVPVAEWVLRRLAADPPGSRDQEEAIGIEIEERYCEIAVRRLAQGVLPI
jgi:DNA (cytosine-5)-methyltransferase 1